MGYLRTMGAGLAGSTTKLYGNANVNQIQYGDKLQGLPPVTGRRDPYRVYKSKAGGNAPGRFRVFCMNQLGGIGMGNKNSQFAPNADGLGWCPNRKNSREGDIGINKADRGNDANRFQSRADEKREFEIPLHGDKADNQQYGLNPTALAYYDTNGDGKITGQEYVKLWEDTDNYDANKNGILDDDEYLKLWNDIDAAAAGSGAVGDSYPEPEPEPAPDGSIMFKKAGGPQFYEKIDETKLQKYNLNDLANDIIPSANTQSNGGPALGSLDLNYDLLRSEVGNDDVSYHHCEGGIWFKTKHGNEIYEVWQCMKPCEQYICKDKTNAVNGDTFLSENNEKCMAEGTGGEFGFGSNGGGTLVLPKSCVMCDYGVGTFDASGGHYTCKAAACVALPIDEVYGSVNTATRDELNKNILHSMPLENSGDLNGYQKCYTCPDGKWMDETDSSNEKVWVCRSTDTSSSLDDGTYQITESDTSQCNDCNGPYLTTNEYKINEYTSCNDDPTLIQHKANKNCYKCNGRNHTWYQEGDMWKCT